MLDCLPIAAFITAAAPELQPDERAHAAAKQHCEDESLTYTLPKVRRFNTPGCLLHTANSQPHPGNPSTISETLKRCTRSPGQGRDGAGCSHTAGLALLSPTSRSPPASMEKQLLPEIIPSAPQHCNLCAWCAGSSRLPRCCARLAPRNCSSQDAGAQAHFGDGDSLGSEATRFPKQKLWQK